MIIFSSIYYKTRDTSSNYERELMDVTNQSFGTPSPDRTTIVINTPYHAVNIVNGNGSSIELRLIRDESSGIKIANDVVEHLDFKVENGILNISFKKGFSIEDFRDRIVIFAYSPGFDDLSVKNASNFNLIAVADSLNINLKSCKSFSVSNSAMETHIQTYNGDTTNHMKFNETIIKMLNVDLDDSKFLLSDMNMETLNIKAENHSFLELDCISQNKEKPIVKNLRIKTLGVNNVKINNFNTEKITADFSDETTLDIPGSILKGIVNNN
ncbi:hypothetical protein ADIARSV_2275 [Arcticibacter svalbardensis MN12-7]|uniref:Putative auto-transporter adhesin head GIN domain-containing protein n=2 Tax=Arcticibacter TaxID=1288026 RepID=R9GS70_9SPHI|nr:hypothetical protein ADIARSV_2275 [Arcticibacter svalbardensis MN12-7]